VGGERRTLLFALAVLALIASAAALALSDPRSGPEAAPRPPSPARVAGSPSTRTPAGEDLPRGRGAAPALLSARRAVIASARRFLAAFLRYEVGMVDGRVARALRATATEDFAVSLLRSPPRPRAGAMPAQARLLGLGVELAPGAAPRALILGTLRRDGRVESFAFEFERRGERWLAAGVAE